MFRWCNENISELERINSPLEFYLHRSNFLKLCFNDNDNDYDYDCNEPKPLTYFKKNLAKFLNMNQFKLQSQSLLASLAFPDLSNSPYSQFTSPHIHSTLLLEQFEHDWCKLNNFPLYDHLQVALDVGGSDALFIIQRVKDMMNLTHSEWSQSNELPVELPIKNDNFKFHSVFICPISKEQTNDKNPPMMLNCGHVLALDSLNKLSKGGGRVKCPYCPSESQASTALRLYF